MVGLFLQWETDSDQPQHFLTTMVLIGTAQSLLIAIRAAVYTAVSTAYSRRQNTIAVLRSTPYSLAGAQLAKVVAALLPMWVELAALLPLNLILFSAWGGVSPFTTIALTLFLALVGAVFGCFGMWLGLLIPDPERAAGCARGLVLIILLLSPFLESIGATWQAFFVAGLLWVLYCNRNSQQTGALILTFLLALPCFHLYTEALPYKFQLSSYNPVSVIHQLAEPLPSAHLMGPELAQVSQGERVSEQVIRNLAYQMAPEEAQRRALHHLLPTALLYSLMALAFFQLTFLCLKTLY